MFQDQKQTDTGAGTRAGGDVVSKGASQAPPDNPPTADTRAGGDVVSKGPARDENKPAGTRAGGDVVSKGAQSS